MAGVKAGESGAIARQSAGSTATAEKRPVAPRRERDLSRLQASPGVSGASRRAERKINSTGQLTGLHIKKALENADLLLREYTYW